MVARSLPGILFCLLFLAPVSHLCAAPDSDYYGFGAPDDDDNVSADQRIIEEPDFILPDNKPLGKDVWITYRLLPLALVEFGEIKEGSRGETETLEFERDLDLNPFMFGYMTEAKIHYKRRWTFGLEYMRLRSASEGKQTHQPAVTWFNGLNIPQGDRTRSELSFEWIRGEIGLVFYEDWFYVELLFGGRFTATKLQVRGKRGTKVGRQKSFNLLLPGAIAGLRVHKQYWAQLELRNSFISVPIGHQLTDGRLSVFYLYRNMRIGVGGQFTSLVFFRQKQVIQQKKVNKYSYFELTGLGLYIELQIGF